MFEVNDCKETHSTQCQLYLPWCYFIFMLSFCGVSPHVISRHVRKISKIYFTNKDWISTNTIIYLCHERHKFSIFTRFASVFYHIILTPNIELGIFLIFDFQNHRINRFRSVLKTKITSWKYCIVKCFREESNKELQNTSYLFSQSYCNLPCMCLII